MAVTRNRRRNARRSQVNRRVVRPQPTKVRAQLTQGKFMRAQPTKRNQNDSKENEPPRRNPVRKVRQTSKKDKKKQKKKKETKKSELSSEELKRQTLEEVVREEMQFIERYLRLPGKEVSLAEVSAMTQALQVHLQLNLWDQADWQKMKNCRHLTLVQIKESFEKYKTKLSKIHGGEAVNTRHNAFVMKPHSKVVLSTRDTIQLFRYQQIELMFHEMIKVFGDTDDTCEYISEVLVPEFCLMIFMDTYKMKKRATVKYLKSFHVKQANV